MKRNKGITLIALVITIIILIILAAVSISILMGEDGLITKAKQGALNYQNAALEEQEMLNNFYGDFASEIAKANGDLSVLTHIEDESSATSDKILKDYKAYVNGQLITGQIVDKSGETIAATTIEKSGDNALITIPADGYYTTTSKISVPVETIQQEVIGDVSDIPSITDASGNEKVYMVAPTLSCSVNKGTAASSGRLTINDDITCSLTLKATSNTDDCRNTVYFNVNGTDVKSYTMNYSSITFDYTLHKGDVIYVRTFFSNSLYNHGASLTFNSIQKI